MKSGTGTPSVPLFLCPRPVRFLPCPLPALPASRPSRFPFRFPALPVCFSSPPAFPSVFLRLPLSALSVSRFSHPLSSTLFPLHDRDESGVLVRILSLSYGSAREKAYFRWTIGMKVVLWGRFVPYRVGQPARKRIFDAR